MSKLTKKHFEAIGAAVSLITDPAEKRIVMGEMEEMCKESNPMFDENRFRQTCGETA